MSQVHTLLQFDMNYSQTVLSNHLPDSCSIKNEPTLPASEEPPSLGYDIVSRKRSIAISALGIVVTNGITPAVLFYGLAYGEFLKLISILFSDLNTTTQAQIFPSPLSSI